MHHALLKTQNTTQHKTWQNTQHIKMFNTIQNAQLQHKENTQNLTKHKTQQNAKHRKIQNTAQWENQKAPKY